MSKLKTKRKSRGGPITSTQRDFGDINLDNIIYTSRDERVFNRHLEVAIELSRKNSAIQDLQVTKKADPVRPLDQPSSPFSSPDGSSQEPKKTDVATLNQPSSSDEISQEPKKTDLATLNQPSSSDEISQENKKSDLPNISEEIVLPTKEPKGFSQDTLRMSDLSTTSEEILLPTKKRKSDDAAGDLLEKNPPKSRRILDSDDDDDFEDFQDRIDSDEDFVVSKKPPPAKKEKKNKLPRSKKNDAVDKKKKDSVSRPKSKEDSPIKPKSKAKRILKIESEDEDDIIPDLDIDEDKSKEVSLKNMPSEKKSSPVKREIKSTKKIDQDEDGDDDFNMEKDGENVKPKQIATIKPRHEQKQSPKKSSNLFKSHKKTATTTTTSYDKTAKTATKVSTAKPKDSTPIPQPSPSSSSSLGVRTRPIFQMPKWNPPAMIGKGSGNTSSPSTSLSTLKISSSSPGIRVGLSRLVNYSLGLIIFPQIIFCLFTFFNQYFNFSEMSKSNRYIPT